MTTTNTDFPPEGVHHYDESSDVPHDVQKYWHQRYDIWSRYDEGVWMTDDAWFGVTPEPVAHRVAADIASAAPAHKTTIINTFCGAGGDTIAFALSARWQRVFAIEKDPAVLACAKHNAEIYGVKNKIVFILGDCMEVLQTRLKALPRHDVVVFGSPPWGGPAYTNSNVFDLSTMQPYSLKDLYVPFSAFTHEVVLFLPRSSDLNQLARYASRGGENNLEVCHYCMGGWSKAICVFFGSWEWA